MKLKISLALLFLGMGSVGYAQKVRWPDGQTAFRKIDIALYEPVPAGVVSVKIACDTVWLLLSGKADESEKWRGYMKHADDRVMFYRDYGMVAYFTPSEGRYYRVSSEGDTILKEAHVGVLRDGVLFNNEGETRYLIDADFDPVVLGALLFIY